MTNNKRTTTKKKPSPVLCVGEKATPERCRQLGGVMTEFVASEVAGNLPTRRQRVRIENVLDIMFRHRVNPLTDPQYTAGLKFYELFNREKNGKQFKVLCSPFLIDGSPADAEWKMLGHIHSARYLVEAYKVLTSEERGIVRKVCGPDDFPDGKRENRILRIALDKLAVFWGYAPVSEK